jgi:hypothetical protein
MSFAARHLFIRHNPPTISPSCGNQRRRNLTNASFRRKQVELRRRIPCILDFQPYTKTIEVRSNRGRKGKDRRAGANDEDICTLLALVLLPVPCPSCVAPRS